MLSSFRGYLRLSQSTIDSFHSTFSPLRLFSQIVILQLFYYFSALITFSLVAWLSGYQFTLEWIFSWTLISSENILGWTLSITWLLNSLLCVLFMTFVIGRSKLAWDFALTLHTINFFVVWIYSHQIPAHILWWVLQISSCALLVGLGTWSTRWKELRDTFFEGMLDTEAQPVEMSDIPK